MPKSLFVVESPAKAKTIRKYLGGDFFVKATVGHIKDLPPNTLGVTVAKDFAPQYRVIRGKSKVVDDLRRSAQGVSEVYLASDPDREGEAIAWHVVEEISRGRKAEELPRFYRVLMHEITRNGLKKALASVGELDEKRYESQVARRVLDRLVGYELSPLLWQKVCAGLSAGRVQSVAVALVLDREREIISFVAQEYWIIKALLEGKVPPHFSARLTRIDGTRTLVPDRAAAAPLIDRLKQARFVVSGVKREERSKYPPPPFITSTLQQEAHRICRFSAKRTMSLAQKLYEGVDLGGLGTHGLITYMRTDSTRVADEAVLAVRTYIAATFGEAYMPRSPNRYRNSKAAQDAHEAIRPTSMEFAPDKVAHFLDPESARLYSLIWNRFVACQMAPARFDVTSLEVLADEHWTFEAEGRVLLFDGYLKLFRDTENGEAEAAALPPLSVGEVLSLKGVDGEQKFTEPPPRFTEGTLVRELERRGIGRPSTYATILSTIQDKQYVEKEKGKFKPTELGGTVTDLLRENFPDIMDVGFTAQLEEELDRIEEGQTEKKQLLTNFWKQFEDELNQARTKMRNIKREPVKSGVACPRCGRDMVIRFGKKGAFLACTGYPECKTTLQFTRDAKGLPVVAEEQEATTTEKCGQCGSDLVLRDGRYGRFWACTSYPKCKFTRPFLSGHACPVDGCGGSLVEKRTARRETYYKCSHAPGCNFALFGRLLPRTCESCGNPFLEEKGRGQVKRIRCPKCGTTAAAEEA